MPTPVIYENAVVDPFAHLDPVHKSNRVNIFYATNRKGGDQQPPSYSNRVDKTLHLGKASVRMGSPDFSWDDLVQYHFEKNSVVPVPVYLDSVQEQTKIPLKPENEPSLSPTQKQFFAEINEELALAVDKEIMVYVHGTKADFTRSTLLTAEIDHFAGRDFVGIAFAWPCHQNILYYLTGIDVHRAVQSVSALKELIRLLAKHTDAEHINVLAYSAGGKVTTQALYELRQEMAGARRGEYRERLHLGSVILAAIDVEENVFLERLPGISELAEQVVITVTDYDNALIAAKRFMGGDSRAGDKDAEELEESFILQHHLANVEIIDVSYGQQIRGFDINGHHYWYRHPWMSSEIIFLLRTNLPPERRGLSPTELESIWYLSKDYPDKIREAASNELKGQW